MRRHLYIIMLLLLPTILFAEKYYPSVVDLSVKPGSVRHLSELNLLTPLLQQRDSIIFTNIRGQVDNQQSQEINVGIGKRDLHEDYIIGYYGFLDVRNSSHDNKFYQVTAGAEYLSQSWDYRANIYIPINKEEKLSTPINQTLISSANSALIRYSDTEKALYGVDIEIGKHMPFYKNDIMTSELVLYGGGYYFNQIGVDRVAGPRARLEYKIYDIATKDGYHWLPDGANLTLGIEAQRDSVRGGQTFGIAKLRIPIYDSPTNSAADHHLQHRMVDSLIRDVDIVTGNVDAVEPALFADSDNNVSGVSNVNTDTALYNATSNGSANTIVQLENNIETSLESTLKTGQRLVSAGDIVKLKTASGVTLNYVVPGAGGAKKITGTLPGSNPITIVDGSKSSVNIAQTNVDGTVTENPHQVVVVFTKRPETTNEEIGRVKVYNSKGELIDPSELTYNLIDPSGNANIVIDSSTGIIRTGTGTIPSTADIGIDVTNNGKTSRKILAVTSQAAFNSINTAILGTAGILPNSETFRGIQLLYGNDYNCSGDTNTAGGTCDTTGTTKIQMVKNIIERVLRNDTNGEIQAALLRNNAAMTLFNNSSDKDNGGALLATRRETQDLQADETFVNAITNRGRNTANNRRSAAVEEIVHLIHNYGITNARPDIQKRLDAATAEALAAGKLNYTDADNDGFEDADDLPRRDLDDEYFADSVEAYFNIRGGDGFIKASSVCSSGGVGGATACAGANTSRNDLFTNHRAMYDIVEEIFGTQQNFFD